MFAGQSYIRIFYFFVATLQHQTSFTRITSKNFSENYNMDEKEYQIALGKKIATLRKERNWKQEDLARESGIERSSLARMEAGHVNSTINKLRQIANAFGIRIGELVDL